MSSFFYLLALLVSLGGLGWLDYRYKLVLCRHRAAGLKTIAVGVAFFLAWDIAGIGFNVFYKGDSPYLVGLHVLPEVPIEEVFFLTLLCYQTLILWEAFGRWRGRHV